MKIAMEFLQRLGGSCCLVVVQWNCPAMNLQNQHYRVHTEQPWAQIRGVPRCDEVMLPGFRQSNPYIVSSVSMSGSIGSWS